MQTFEFYFLLFIIYSFLGWVNEVCYTMIHEHKFVNRGFFLGPYCPIFGCGAVMITVLLTRYIELPLAVFAIGMVLCCSLEYLTSYIMEKLFKARWWDYSDQKFNLNGRICLHVGLLFGLASCAILYFFNPFIFSFINWIHPIVRTIIFWILFIQFIVDVIISFNIITNLKKEAIRFAGKDNTEEITKKVREVLAKKSIFTRRLVNAFPHLQSIKLPLKYNKKGKKKNEREI